ncbi:MAG: cytidine deaminase [Alphaproteobacteria bacterium]
MERLPLDAGDEELIEAARATIRQLYRENRHHIAAALRTTNGRIHTAVHLDTYVGRASVCAEAIAVGKAIASGDPDIAAIVSVRHPRPREMSRDIQVVSPCGICRELLNDFAPNCTVIIPADGELARVPVAQLLPSKYVRNL